MLTYTHKVQEQELKEKASTMNTDELSDDEEYNKVCPGIERERAKDEGARERERMRERESETARKQWGGRKSDPRHEDRETARQ